MFKILRLPAVLEKTGLSRQALYRLMNAGKFPASVKLSLRAVGWHEEDIENWLRELPDRPDEIYKAARKLLALNRGKAAQ